MSANLYCWTRRLGLDPKARDFHARIEALHEGPALPASPQLLAFVADLLARYPDLDDSGEDNTVWAAGPLADEIVGDYINLAIVWPRVEEAFLFVIETAHRHGLHAYDPQGEEFFPCPGAGTPGGTPQRRRGTADALPAVTTGNLILTLLVALILGMVAYGLWSAREFLGLLWAAP